MSGNFDSFENSQQTRRHIAEYLNLHRYSWQRQTRRGKLSPLQSKYKAKFKQPTNSVPKTAHHHYTDSRIRKLFIPVNKNQSHYRPEVPRGFQEVTVPRLHDSGTGWW